MYDIIVLLIVLLVLICCCLGFLNNEERPRYVPEGNSVRSPSFSSNDRTVLVKELVNKFKHQRKRNAEFAVLFLFSTEDSSQWINAVSTCNYVRYANPCNPYPGQSENCTNYVTARPGSEGHAEVIVLNRLNDLVQLYEMQHRGSCRTIMLYTWLPPCLECVREIHRVLRQYTATHRVVVIYTVRGEGDFRILRDCGIEVYGVAYEEYLPPPDDN